MEQNLIGGRIWKGSDAQIDIVLYPRNYTGGANNTKVVVYTDEEVTIEIPEVIVSGTIGTIKLASAQLQMLNDGLIRYTVSYDIDGTFYYVKLETKWYLKTPSEFKPVDFVTTDNVRDIVKEEIEVDGAATKDEVKEGDEAVKNWVEEQKYITESSLTEYAKSEDIPTKLSELNNDSGYVTSADTSGYTTMEEVEAKGYLTEHQSLSGYATESWVENKGYLTEHQSLEGYAKTSDIPAKTSQLTNDSGYVTSADTSGYTTMTEVEGKGYTTMTEVEGKGYTTMTEVEGKGYLTEHQSLEGYAKSEDIPAKTSQLTNDSGYVTSADTSGYTTMTEVEGKGYTTMTEVEGKGYLTEHQSLKGYATESWVNEQLDGIADILASI